MCMSKETTWKMHEEMEAVSPSSENLKQLRLFKTNGDLTLRLPTASEVSSVSACVSTCAPTCRCYFLGGTGGAPPKGSIIIIRHKFTLDIKNINQ